jgi:hypothetical protein
MVFNRFQVFLAFSNWRTPLLLFTGFLIDNLHHSLRLHLTDKRQSQGLASRRRICNRHQRKPGSCFQIEESSQEHAATKSGNPWENSVEKCNCHQRIKEYDQRGKGGRPQMLAGFCRFKRYQTSAATHHKLQEQTIVTARRPEKCCAWQHEERRPFHNYCKHSRLLIHQDFEKSWETGQVRRRNPEELS